MHADSRLAGHPVWTFMVLILLAGDAVMAQTDIDIETRNKALVAEAFKAWQAGTGSPFDLLADDATWTIAGRSLVATTYFGRESFLHEVIRPFNARMQQPLQPVVREVIADGEQVIVLFDASAVARDGLPYVNTYAWFLRLRGGKVIEVTAFFDSIAFDDLWRRVQPVSSRAGLQGAATRL